MINNYTFVLLRCQRPRTSLQLISVFFNPLYTQPHSFPSHDRSQPTIVAERAARILDAVSVDSDPSQPHPSIHVPVPTRAMVLRSKSSGAVMHSKEDTSEYVKTIFKPEDRRAMSPRRSGENIEALIRELRADLSRWALPVSFCDRCFYTVIFELSGIIQDKEWLADVFTAENLGMRSCCESR